MPMESAPKVAHKIETEWLYRRLQAVGRAQSRYFLLSLLTSVYSIGLRFTTDPAVSVAFLGLAGIPKGIVAAGAMIVLDVLLLALFGSFQAARRALLSLAARLGDESAEPSWWDQVDEHPNAADFLGYSTYVDGKPSKWKQASVVVYPLPVFAMVVWTIVLWWEGASATAAQPAWLPWFYRASGLLMLWVLLATRVFARRRWHLFRESK
jgi:hypothetical protein